MEKAYDIKDLVSRVKAELPEVGEESVKAIVKHVFPWLTESAALSDTKIDDMLAMGYPIIKAQLDDVVEDINSADNV